MNNSTFISNELLAFFPKTAKEFPTYIKQDIFMYSIKELIEKSKPVNPFFAVAPPIIDPSPVFTNVSGIFPQIQGTDYRYYTDIWNTMKQLVYTMEWRIKSDGPSESAKLRAQANAQLKSVVTDVTVSVVTFGIGKGITKLTKKLPVRTIKHKFLKGNIRTETTTFFGKPIGFSASHKFQVKGKLGQEITKKGLGHSANITALEISTSGVIKKFHDTIQPADEYQAFDSLDEHPVWSTILDIAPLFGTAKSIVDGVANAALAYQNYQIANRVEANEQHSTQAEQIFNDRIKKSIYDDIESLQIVGVEKLIKYLNIESI
jgi:hypothetical protein